MEDRDRLLSLVVVVVVMVMLGQVRGIHVTTRSEDSLVREGEVSVLHCIICIIYTVSPVQALTLHCHTDTPWFLCVWTSSSGGKQCAIQERSVSSVCAGDPRIVMSGAATRLELATNLRRRRPLLGDYLCPSHVIFVSAYHV